MSDERFDWYGESNEDEDAPPVVLRVVLGLALLAIAVGVAYSIALLFL